MGDGDLLIDLAGAVSAAHSMCRSPWRSIPGHPAFRESSFSAGKLSLVRYSIPCFACTPQRLPELLEGALRGANLVALADRLTQAAKAK